jgi:hypothetical protein
MSRLPCAKWSGRQIEGEYETFSRPKKQEDVRSPIGGLCRTSRFSTIRPSAAAGIGAVYDPPGTTYLVSQEPLLPSLALPVNPKYLRSLSSLFTRPVVAELAATGRSSTFAKFAAAAGLNAGAPVGALYSLIYDRLMRDHRCEYVFKNEIARQLLLQRHSWKGARLLTEFRIGSAKADAVIVNGTSTVYEIKTALDNLDRLSKQLAAYARAFDRIYVVCEATQVDRIVESVADDRVGLIAMQDGGDLREVRPAAPNAANTDTETMLAALRKAEYLAVVEAEAGAVPSVSNGRLWTECVKLMWGMDPERVHAHVVRLLRARIQPGELETAVRTAPPALSHAVLTLAAPAADLVRLRTALAAPALAG